MGEGIILFDLDETLIVENGSVERTFLAVSEAVRETHGVDPAKLSVTVRREARARWRESGSHAFCLEMGISSWEGLTGSFAGTGEELAELRRFVPGYRVEAVIVSCEVGYGKPDPRIFRAALDRIDPAWTGAAMVGDSLGRDILGARRAGIPGIWINRHGRSPDHRVTPDAEVRSLTGPPPLV